MTNASTSSPCWAFIWEPGQLQTAMLALRLLAGLGAGYVAWLLLGPLVRIPFRMTQNKAMPPWGVLTSRLGGSFLVGLLVFSLLPIGIGGRGGPGLGSGAGDGGDGTHQGSNGDHPGKGGQAAVEKKKKEVFKVDKGGPPGGQDKKKKGEAAPTGGQGFPGRVVVPIELLGGRRYKGDGRFYLVHGKYPPRDLAGVEETLQKVGDPLARPVGVLPASLVGLLAPGGCGPLLAVCAAGPRKEVQVQIVLFPDSVAESHSAVQRLRELADRKYRFATMILELP